MKLGLVCNNNIRNSITERIQSLGIELVKDADLFIVEEGLQNSFSTCIVFSHQNIEDLLRILKELLPILNTNRASYKIVGLRDEEYYMIDYDRILYFEARDSIVYCHTANDEFKVKEKLFSIEKTLPTDQFIRVNKSYIVNINSISKIIPWFNRRLLLKFHEAKKEIEVSKNYVQQFKKFLGIR